MMDLSRYRETEGGGMWPAGSPKHCTENHLVLAQDKRGPGFCSQSPSALEIPV